MGYANPNQVAGGIHFRQYARSYIVQQGSTRIVFVNVDACMGSMLVKLEVWGHFIATKRPRQACGIRNKFKVVMESCCFCVNRCFIDYTSKSRAHFP